MRAIMAVLLIGAALVVGCGDDEGSSGSGGGGGAEPVAAGGEPLAPDAVDGAKGDVTLCLPKDVSGAFHKTIDAFNSDQSAINAKLLELPESADEQRNQLIQRSQAKSPECDVMGIDVIWTAEFASQGWLTELTEVVEQRRDEFIASTLETGHYGDKYWILPQNANAALLYYRTDQVPEAPTTWEQTYEEAAANNGITYQGAAYEGLTCDFLELVYSAGGQVLSDDGKSSAVDSQPTRDALQFMVDGISDGAAPKAVVTSMEEQSRRSFEQGATTFMRNWPYAYATGQRSKIKGKFKITTLPGFQGKPGAGVLGGTNLAISAFSKNKGAALAVVNYFTGKVGQRLMGEGATPPALKSAYEEPTVRKAIGLPDEILQAIGEAKPRPVSPVYPQISQAIYKNVNQALSGAMPVDDAVTAMNSEIEKALATF